MSLADARFVSSFISVTIFSVNGDTAPRQSMVSLLIETTQMSGVFCNSLWWLDRNRPITAGEARLGHRPGGTDHIENNPLCFFTLTLRRGQAGEGAPY